MATQRPTCLLIGTSPAQARMVRETLSGAQGGTIGLTHATRLSEGLALLAHGVFDVVLLDCPLIDAAPNDALARVVRAARGAGIALLVRPVDEADGRSALTEGAHAYLVKDTVWELDRARLSSAIEAALASSRPVAPPARRGSVVSVVGVAGGNGTTSTALRLAQQLAREGKSTALAELRSWPGGLVNLIDAKPAGHLGLLLGPDPVSVAQVLTPVSTRLQVLLAPPTDRADRELTAERTTRILTELARLAERVVVELPCEVSPSFEVACLASSLIVLVTDTAPAAVRQGRCIVQLLRDWSVPPERICAVAVHRSAERIADPASVHKAMGCAVLDPLLHGVGQVLDEVPVRAQGGQVCR